MIWPILIVILLILFRQTIHTLLTGVNTLSVKLFGHELTFSRADAKDTLQAVVEELFKDLDEAQRSLFYRVRDARGTADLARIFGQFARGTPEHNLLRSLRDRLVLMPIPRGSWKPEKRPVVTEIAENIFRRNPDAVPRPSDPEAYRLTDAQLRAKYDHYDQP